MPQSHFPYLNLKVEGKCINPKYVVNNWSTVDPVIPDPWVVRPPYIPDHISIHGWSSHYKVILMADPLPNATRPPKIWAQTTTIIAIQTRPTLYLIRISIHVFTIEWNARPHWTQWHWFGNAGRILSFMTVFSELQSLISIRPTN
jgi:hypothetical protein